MIKVGITGGDSEAAGELLRILIHHPDVEIEWVESAANAGREVAMVHRGFIGEEPIVFTDTARYGDVDVLFNCAPVGTLRQLLTSAPLPEELRIIDVTGDYRDDDDGQHYDFLYGLPELHRKWIVKGKRVALPSPVAAILALPLLPLARNLMLNSDIDISLMAGSSLIDQLSYDRIGSLKQELHATLRRAQTSFYSAVNIEANIGQYARGIVATASVNSAMELDELRRLFEEYYDDHGFVFVAPYRPQLNDVANTCKCLLYLRRLDRRVEITAVADNVIKGCAGLAVHNMNLLFGLEESVGLNLKVY